MSQSDPIAAAKTRVAGVLRKHIAEEELEKVVDEVIDSIASLITTNAAPKNRLGATVMTEGASIRRPDGNFGTKPRTM